MDRLLYVVLMPRTIEPGHQHIDAVAQANEKAGEQGDKDACGTHSTQRGRACKPSHNGNVRHVEQHLQQVGKRQRQADQKDLLRQRAFGQGFGS